MRVVNINATIAVILAFINSGSLKYPTKKLITQSVPEGLPVDLEQASMSTRKDVTMLVITTLVPADKRNRMLLVVVCNHGQE